MWKCRILLWVYEDALNIVVFMVHKAISDKTNFFLQISVKLKTFIQSWYRNVSIF